MSWPPEQLAVKLLQLLLALACAGGAQAQSATPAPGRAASSTAAAAASLASGEVLEIDRKEKRVLVKHGPIASIGMDAMTMEFLVPDAKLLQTLKPGDQIRFAVLWRNGEYEITRAEVRARKPVKP